MYICTANLIMGIVVCAFIIVKLIISNLISRKFTYFHCKRVFEIFRPKYKESAFLGVIYEGRYLIPEPHERHLGGRPANYEQTQEELGGDPRHHHPPTDLGKEK